MLTPENIETLEAFLAATGTLDGLSSPQARAVCIDLFWIVNVIVMQAIDRNLEEWTALQAGDRASLFERGQTQLSWPH